MIQDSKTGVLKTSSSIQFTTPTTASNKSTGDRAEISVKEENKVAQKRMNYMNEYLKNVFFALSLNQMNLDGLIVIYELMK